MHDLDHDSQTSGNDWPQPQRAMAYQCLQQSPSNAEPLPQTDIFKDLEHQMAAFEIEHDQLVSEIRKSYVFSPDDDVVAFLKSYRFIPYILLKAVTPLKAAFGSDTVFTLRVPADEVGLQSIFAVALWPGAASAARTALRNFDETWWFANAHHASGYLNFTDELV